MARALKPPNFRPKLPARVSTRIPKLPKLPDPNEPDVFEEMTLLEHMEELRDRTVNVALAVGIAFIAGVFAANPLLELTQPQANAEQR